MTTVVSSCGNDDDEKNISLSTRLIGTWYEFVTGGYNEYGYNDDNYYIFNADGTGIWYDSPDDYKENKYGDDFTWSTDGDNLTIVYETGSEIKPQIVEKSHAVSVTEKSISWTFTSTEGDPTQVYSTVWERK